MRKQPNKYRPTTPHHLMAGFDNHAQKLAMREGWVLVYLHDAKTFAIQKYDVKSPFVDDAAAHLWLRYNKRCDRLPHRRRAWLLCETARRKAKEISHGQEVTAVPETVIP